MFVSLPISFANAKGVEVSLEHLGRDDNPEIWEWFAIYIDNTGGPPITKINIEVTDGTYISQLFLG